MNVQRLACTLITIVTMALTGCGGGSSTSSMADPTAGGDSRAPSTTPGDDVTNGTPGSLFRVPSDASIPTGLSRAIATAAGNQPVAGSLTQSSDGTNAVSDDSVGVEVTWENGRLMYDVSYDGSSLVSTARGQAAKDVARILDRPKGTELFERVSGQGWNGVTFYRSLRAGEAETGSVAGDLWVNVYTDYGMKQEPAPGAPQDVRTGDTVSFSNTDDSGPPNTGTMRAGPDTDYLAGGIWMFAPDTATGHADYEFGAFVDGNDPFTTANVMPLTGTATYQGNATGVYSDQTRNFFFDARALLTADFGTGNGLGTISGEIHTLQENGALFLGNPTLTLDTTDIGDTKAGFFNGNTSLNYAGMNFTGKWGGGFFGNGESDGRPGAVAGTFGAATSDGDQSLVGVFNAYKQ